MRLWYLPVTIILIGVFVSCSSPTENFNQPITPEIQASQNVTSGTYVWGLYNVIVDPDVPSMEFIPLRTAETEVNVVKFLQDPGIGPKISVSNLQVNKPYLDVDVHITHPFASFPEFAGFTVRGVVITDGSMGGFANENIIVSSPSQLRLTNQDGMTRWMNPKEFPYDNTILNYWPGHLGDPNGAQYSSTVNPYKLFADGLTDTDDNLDLDENNLAMFSAGTTNSRHFSMNFGIQPTWTYQYAVVASHDMPLVNPPTGPQDFPAGTVASEPWRVDVIESSNTLTYFGGSLSGELIYDVDVRDFENADQVDVYLEAPDAFPRQQMTFAGQNGSVYSFNLDVQNFSIDKAGTFDCLVAAVATDAPDYDGRLPGEELATYKLVQFDVEGDEPPTDWIFFDDFETLDHIWVTHGGTWWGEINGIMDAAGGTSCYEENDGSGDENTNVSYVSTPTIDIPDSTQDALLTFDFEMEVDIPEEFGHFAWDMCFVRINGQQIFPTGGALYEDNFYPWTFDEMNCWTSHYDMTSTEFNLGTGYNGTTVEIEFVLDTYDNIDNCDPPHFGWHIDNVLLKFAG